MINPLISTKRSSANERTCERNDETLTPIKLTATRSLQRVVRSDDDDGALMRMNMTGVLCRRSRDSGGRGGGGGGDGGWD